MVIAQNAAATRVNSPTVTRIAASVSARAAAQAKNEGQREGPSARGCSAKPVVAAERGGRACPIRGRVARPRPASRRTSNAKSRLILFKVSGAQAFARRALTISSVRALHLGLVRALGHHAQQRLGARVSHHQAPASVEGGARAVERLPDLGDGLDVLLLAHADVAQDLRIDRRARRPARPGSGPECRTTSSTLRPVSRPSPVGSWSRKMTWPLCSPPRLAPAPLHLLEHVAVAHRRAHQRDAQLAERDLEARRCSSRWPPRRRPSARPCACRWRAARKSTWSPSTTRPVGVGQDAAIAVAVEGQAEVGAARAWTRSATASGAVAPQPRLMLRPSGWSLMAVTRAPRPSNRRAGQERGRAVRAVDREVQPLQGRARRRSAPGGAR